jgi:REP element-mobilizing transposase RayT
MQKHNRGSIRLYGYDYAQPGWYFITICTFKHHDLFGQIDNGHMILNDAGEIAKKCWLSIPDHFPNAKLDEYIIMPDHIHGIINIVDDNGTGATHPTVQFVGAKNFSPLPNKNKSFRSPSKTLGSMIRGFKIGVTKWIRKNTDNYHVWQRGFYEHIIRDEDYLNRIRKYIRHNPKNWNNDRF